MNAKTAALQRVEASQLGKVLSEMTTRRVIVGLLTTLLVLPFLNMQDTESGRYLGLKLLYNFGISRCDTHLPPPSTDSLSVADLQYQSTFYDDSPFAMKGDAITISSLLTHENVLERVEKSGASPQVPFCDSTRWVSDTFWAAMVYLYAHISENRSPMAPPVAGQLLYLRLPDPRHRSEVRDIMSVESDLGVWQTPDPKCVGLVLPPQCPFRTEEVLEVFFQPWDCHAGNPNARSCKGVIGMARFDAREVSMNNATKNCIQTLFVCILLVMLAQQFTNDTQKLVIAPVEKMVNIIKQLAVDPLKKPEVRQDDDAAESPSPGKKKKKGPQLETAMLEETILKIGGLLQVSFGEAGADVLKKNMGSGDGELNIMKPGFTIEAIFGYVNIRSFSDINALLEEDVVLFTNTVAQVVHTCVYRWRGLPCESFGDAFLVMWKPSPKATNEIGPQLTFAHADRALLALIKITVEMRRSEAVINLLQHPKLLAEASTTSKYKQVRMGLCLHTGWAIEGPIGSNFKIDAAHLSPHVTLVEFLDTCTSIYGVPIVMSERFYMKLSLRAKEKCRRIDTVKIGEDYLNGIYTFDINPKGTVLRVDEKHQMAQLVVPEELKDIDNERVEADGIEFIFAMDRDVAKQQEGIPETLFTDYRRGLANVAEGKLERAKTDFEHVLSYWPDGPSKAHLQFIKLATEEEPGDKGFHVLDSNTIIAVMNRMQSGLP
jgi:hypothetical protein